MQVGAGHWPAKVPDARRGRRQRCTKRQSKRNYKHGRYTAEVAAMRRWLREATRMLRDLSKRAE